MEEIPLWYWLLVFFALGACVGSFYNVIVYRMPRGISLINPPSHCPLCKKHIPIRYNLPIVGWLWLRGKSACCHQPISVIYPIGEALCGLLGVLALFSAVAVNAGSVSAGLFSAPVMEPAVWASAFAMFWLLLGRRSRACSGRLSRVAASTWWAGPRRKSSRKMPWGSAT